MTSETPAPTLPPSTRKGPLIPINACTAQTELAAHALHAALTRFAIPYRTIRGSWGELTELSLADVGAGRGTLEIADRDFSLFHGWDEHTGWSIFPRDEHGVCWSNPIYISGDGETVVACWADSFAAAAAVAAHIAARQAPVYSPLRPDHRWEECAGTNRRCKKAHPHRDDVVGNGLGQRTEVDPGRSLHHPR
ncbi:hypothetical protein [Streptomyces olivaceoviridis]|uniref:hypothetical protein n=1 Tax=Streptomyces olivaceoviridis TaxID=1921 RepID=UPI00332CC14F